MSDSLRDQLVKAGFKDVSPTPKRPAPKRPARSNAAQQKSGKRQGAGKSGKHPAAGQFAEQAATQVATQVATQAAAEKKAIKQKIKTLIETHRVAEHTGTVAYSYQLGSRVKQLFVTDEIKQKLAGGELLITRLNGNTHLIPPAIGEQVTELNPDWALIKTDAAGSAGGVDDEYADYQVPDDLNW